MTFVNVATPYRLGETDVADYRTLMLAAYDESPTAFTATVAEREPFPLDWWRTRMGLAGDGRSAVFGIRRERLLAGVVAIEPESRPKTAHKASVMSMYVAPAARGKGLGGQLLGALIAYAETQSRLRLLQLTVTEGNHSAQDLYRRHGFEVFGVEPQGIFHEGMAYSKVHMWRPLRVDRPFNTP